MNIFLVTSAIHGPNGYSGKLSSEQRIEQTVATANSIKEHVPYAKILLLEGGKIPLNYKLRTHLRSYYDDILDYTQSAFIQFAHNNVDISKQGITVIKGPCESFMLKEACKLLETSSYDRVFKISGRYCLSERFNYADHKEPGKYVMKEKMKCLEYYADPRKKAYSPFQYSTRLYSFCGSLLPQAIANYERINTKLLELYTTDNYIDIEHMTYLSLEQNLIKEVSVIGLTGAFAENPEWKIDE